jgi:L-ascorbate metabolism protein UlaG (beta-lactamase superfamily)
LASTHAQHVGDSFVVGEGTSALEFRVVRTGFPLNFVAVAYVISPTSGNGPTVFFDPHLPSFRSARQVKSAEVLVAPVKGVVAGPLPATAGPARVARTARALGARTIIPTSLEPRRDWNRWQKVVFRVWGSADALQRRVGSASRVVPTTDTVVNVS